MVAKSLDLIGASLGWGAKRHEAEKGPAALQAFGLKANHNWRCFIKPELTYTPDKNLNYSECLTQVKHFNQQLAQEVMASQINYIPLVIGGDHAIAMGTWSAMVASLQAAKEFGLIWIDAHMDAHTPQTTPSHAIHGMPLAVLLGRGEPDLVNLCIAGAKLNPAHLVLIGVRSFEEGEAQLLNRLNVKIYFMEEVKKRGFSVIFREALTRVTTQTKGFGVSIDMDAFDPSIAPGTGAAVPGGLLQNDVMPALKGLIHHPLFKALEIAEYDPTLDVDNKTAALVQTIISHVSA